MNLKMFSMMVEKGTNVYVENSITNTVRVHDICKSQINIQNQIELRSHIRQFYDIQRVRIDVGFYRTKISSLLSITSHEEWYALDVKDSHQRIYIDNV